MEEKSVYKGELVERDSARRQHVQDRRMSYWLEIYLPVLAGVAVLAGLVYAIWRFGVGSASSWADASLIFMLPLAMLCCLVPLIVLIAMVVAVAVLTPKLPEPMQQAREFMEQLEGRVRSWSNRIERPFIRGRQFRRSASRMLADRETLDDDGER